MLDAVRDRVPPEPRGGELSRGHEAVLARGERHHLPIPSANRHNVTPGPGTPGPRYETPLWAA
jgi:hypothetical protein